MINNVILVGTISNEVEVKHVGEFDVCNLVLRVMRNFREMETNEYKCDFIPVTFWNVYALNIGQYCAKGDIVGVKGRISRKVVANINDTKIYSSEIIGEKIIFINLKSYNNLFPNLKDKSTDDETDYGAPSLEELKKMAKSVDVKELVRESEEESGLHNINKKDASGDKNTSKRKTKQSEEG